jgi:hypothetical protein
MEGDSGMMYGAEQRIVGVGASVQSALLKESRGILHAFSTRTGGVSKPPFATLNLGQGVGDNPAAVEENRHRFFGTFGIEMGQVVRARQVHGDSILKVDVALTGRVGFPRYLVDERAECDALITSLPGLALVVSTADCVPVLIHDPVRGAIAAIHAGWRGTAKGIAARALTAMREAYGTDPSACLVAIGPCIRGCCFEVDAVVREAMATTLPNPETYAVANRPDHWLLDLVGVNRAVLERAGVRPDRIEDVRLCTNCRNDLFFSHRAEKGRTGRMMSFILLEGESRQGQGQGEGQG